MNKERTRKRFKIFLANLESFFSSWRFPVFMLSILFFLAILVIVVTLIPVSESTLGTFAGEFKKWCLGYDPATGEIESIYLVMFLVQPTMLSLFIFAFWYKPITEMLKNYPQKAIPYIFPGLLIIILLGSTLPSLYSDGESGELPFPAQDLRTEIEAPDFTLINQDKKQISLSDYRDNVIMITAVYASCSETCPVILDQAREVMQELNRSNERLPLQLMAVTMDPQKDTPKMLKMTAEHYELADPKQHLLTGEKQYVDELLDNLNIPRKRRADGAIDHANIFILIDKDGKVAYRFTLGDRQKKWLIKAVETLIKEIPTV
ncbi:SCO family protein [Fodinibius halophilus]|uniref:Redoxin domain-containing protein n=1 Tax=Fodinibius halophilus TaxID=1736908 RepID=A0A6M1TJK7_9BACT|nr:SCO family protein [Fodinibius halophilus]NGP88780.1 redoxin domain-containing protein [Fodinibius halophilus]